MAVHPRSMAFVLISLVFTALLPAPASGEHPLSSSRLDWELVPGGYLEPRIACGSSLDHLAGLYSEHELVELINDRDCFVLAYVLLMRKTGLDESPPATTTLKDARTWYGSLHIRVVYERGPNGVSKAIAYPELDSQHKTLIQVVSQLKLPVAKPVQSEEHARPMIHSAAKPHADGASIPVVFDVLVQQVGMGQRLAVAEDASWKMIAGGSTIMEAMSSRDDWKGIHVALTNEFYPSRQLIESQSNGFIVYCNGLTARLVRKGDVWDVTFPYESQERLDLVRFWSMRLVGDQGAERQWK
jgi:hypothetical protein